MSRQSSKFKAVKDDEEIVKGDSLYDGANHVTMPSNWIGRTPEDLRESNFLLKGVHVIRGYEDADESEVT